VSKWYNTAEVYRWLKREKPNLLVYAEWFATHLQLAFEKGEQIGAGELRMEVDRLQAIIADLLKACKLTTNICEIVGPSPGALTPKHRVLAQKYAAIGRAAIAKAEGQEKVDRE
jgi:hypothetical protein